MTAAPLRLALRFLRPRGRQGERLPAAAGLLLQQVPVVPIKGITNQTNYFYQRRSTLVYKCSLGGVSAKTFEHGNI